jgi:hypothetical protein
LKAATQYPTANLPCAVAFDGHNIKMAPIIRMIFTMEGSSHHRSLENHKNFASGYGRSCLQNEVLVAMIAAPPQLDATRR